MLARLFFTFAMLFALAAPSSAREWQPYAGPVFEDEPAGDRYIANWRKVWKEGSEHHECIVSLTDRGRVSGMALYGSILNKQLPKQDRFNGGWYMLLYAARNYREARDTGMVYRRYYGTMIMLTAVLHQRHFEGLCGSLPDMVPSTQHP